MDWLALANDIFELCIIPLLGILTSYLIKYLDSKKKQIVANSKNELVNKYVVLLNETISSCVLATNQTYVEALKAENCFSPEAQKEAFQQTYEAVMGILTDESKQYLAEAYGDLSAYITSRIEAEVNLNK